MMQLILFDSGQQGNEMWGVAHERRQASIWTSPICCIVLGHLHVAMFPAMQRQNLCESQCES
eukprot:12466183-Prorocentrum_lima.AAC.1